LVSDLLDLARLQNPDFAMEMSEVDLKAVAEDAVRSIRRVAEKKQMEVRFSCADQSVIVFGDYGRLRQMLLILLDNAVKFSPEGSAVHLDLENTADGMALCIRDEGCGIPADELPFIFERFYKQRSEENKSGTGLGLSIAKQIADRHGIAIEVKSQPGMGTEFIFLLNNIQRDVN
jgi:signal transduction histidine kinase